MRSLLFRKRQPAINKLKALIHSIQQLNAEITKNTEIARQTVSRILFAVLLPNLNTLARAELTLALFRLPQRGSLRRRATSKNGWTSNSTESLSGAHIRGTVAHQRAALSLRPRSTLRFTGLGFIIYVFRV